MTAFRLPSRSEAAYSRHTGRVKASDYLEWIRTLPCVITLNGPVEAAHISFARPELGAPGRGKGRKVSDRWALPLSPDLHRLQHAGNEREFWALRGVDPHLACLVLWGLYFERKQDATEVAERLILKGIGK
jgi:hypothetical protein